MILSPASWVLGSDVLIALPMTGMSGGSKISDVSQHHRPVTNANVAISGAKTLFGRNVAYGSAGTSTYLAVTDSPNFIMTPCCIDAWVAKPRTSTICPLFGDASTAVASGWMLSVATNGKYLFTLDGGNTIAAYSPAQNTDNGWDFVRVICTVSGSTKTYTVYQNGIAGTPVSTTKDYTPSGNPLYFWNFVNQNALYLTTAYMADVVIRKGVGFVGSEIPSRRII